MRYKIFFALLALAIPGSTFGQEIPAAPMTSAQGNTGNVPYRAEFISYDLRETAEKGDLSQNKHYVPLSFNERTASGTPVLATDIDVPYMWLDRDVFVQVEGLPSFRLLVNGVAVGYGEGSRTPLQFNISDYITDGPNTIAIEPRQTPAAMLENNRVTDPKSALSAFIFSQPKARIEDFRITFEPDTTAGAGLFLVRFFLANSYNTPEPITVGYDIYSPEGKLQHYDFREVTVPGRGRDTLKLKEKIYRVSDKVWSPERPMLYYGMLTVKRGSRMVEYIPYYIGYGLTGVGDERVTRNGTPVSLRPVSYNSTPSKQTTSAHLDKLKAAGYNTIYPDNPQPEWFYDLCDAKGLYVISRIDLHDKGNRGMGNDPEWLGAMLPRAEAEFARLRNHTCIIAWSLGGNIENGYNMYKLYLAMKELDPDRAVIFDNAAGQWNSDIAPVVAANPDTVLAAE